MKRVTVNALIDIGCLVTFIPSLLSGLVLFIYLPSGGGKGSGLATFMEISRNTWVQYHNISSFAFAALLILHLLLHTTFFRHIGRCLKPAGNEPPCDQ